MSDPVPARPDPPPEKDPTRFELEALLPTAGPGSIEGLVLRGLDPIPGLEVHLWGERTGPRIAEWRGIAVGSWRTETREDGHFVFLGLEPDSYTLRVEATATENREVSIELGPDEGRGLVISFGASALA